MFEVLIIQDNTLIVTLRRVDYFETVVPIVVTRQIKLRCYNTLPSKSAEISTWTVSLPSLATKAVNTVAATCFPSLSVACSVRTCVVKLLSLMRIRVYSPAPLNVKLAPSKLVK